MIKAAIIGLSIFGLVGAANAEVNINIYGASAQLKYWNDAADNFLTETMICTDVKQAMGENSETMSTYKKHGITAGMCSTDGGTTYEQWYIRYTAKNSIDGVYAARGINPDGVGSCPNANERALADEAATNWSTKFVEGTKCVDITIGASDVESSAFQQRTVGYYDGHLKSEGSATDEYIVSDPDPEKTLTAYRPVVVPFAFFVNNANPIDNLSRMMAAHIYSNQVSSWGQYLGTAFPNLITKCLRHAGSGTHATLHGNIMNGAANLLEEQNAPNIPGHPGIAWFYESSSDIMLCPNEIPGGIAYADADKHLNSDGTQVDEYANVKRINFEGFDALADNIKNGKYHFWAAQWLYVGDDVQDDDPADLLATWAENSSQVPSSKANYWVPQSQMNVGRSDTYTFPTRQ